MNTCEGNSRNIKLNDHYYNKHITLLIGKEGKGTEGKGRHQRKAKENRVELSSFNGTLLGKPWNQFRINY